jgi:Family of unknown function (DUF6049)/Glycosyl hydrolase family 57
VRRLGATLVIAFLLVPAAPARAQADAVRLTLLRQSQFITPDDPLMVRVGVENDTDVPLTDLALRLSVFDPTGSRSEYAVSLETEGALVDQTDPLPVDGSIDPRRTRVLPPVTMKLGFLADFYGNGLFPIKVELLNDGAPVALIRSSVVFIVQEPKVPLNVSLTFVLDAPLRMLPDGSFVDGALADQLGETGRLEVIVGALEERSFPKTLVIGPLLLVQLRSMADGYRLRQGSSVVDVGPGEVTAVRARDMLARIRGLAGEPNVELVALPYASPSIPSLTIPQLGEDLRAQLSRGRRVVAEALAVPPSETVIEPPGGALTETAVAALADTGIETLLLRAIGLEPLSGLTLSPPPVGVLEAGHGRSLDAVITDPGVDERLDDVPDDPRLRAQLVVGELSALFFESPSNDRGVSIVIDETLAPSVRFLAALIAPLTRVPDEVAWLRPAKASRLLTTIGPDEPEPPRRLLEPTPGRRFSSAFLTEMTLTQSALQQYASVAGENAPLLDRLRGLRFAAESRWLLAEEEVALGYLQAARSAVDREFAKIEPPVPTTIRLTSRNGLIPLTIHSSADYAMRVALILRSQRLEFIGGARKEVTLDQPEQLVTFQVRAQTTGRFPVTVVLETPAGGPIAESSILVRSTAYNRVALIITIGAAVFLAAWWGRRFLPRRR